MEVFLLAKDTNQNILSSDRLLKSLFGKVLPEHMVSGLIIMLNTIIDSYITSRLLGADAMAALGFYSPISNLIFLCYVLITGSQILCGNSIGRGKDKEAVSIFSTSALILLIFSFICSIIMFFFAYPIAGLLGATGNSYTMLSSYIRTVAFGVPGLMLYSLFMSFLQMNNRSDLFKISLGVMIVTNLSLDIIFVMVFQWGMSGLGLATSISNLLSMCIALLGVIKSSHRPAVYLSAGNFCPVKIPTMLKLGSNQVVFNLTIALRSYLLNVLLMQAGGTDAVAVMTVLNIVVSFVGMIPTGISDTVLTLGSIFSGEKNQHTIKKLFSLALKTASIMSFIAIIIVSLFASPLAGIFFASNISARNMTTIMLRLVIWYVIFASINQLITKIRHSQGMVLTSNILSTFDSVLVVLISFLLSRFIGTNGIWIAYPTAEIASFFVLFLFIWREGGKPPKQLDDYCGASSKDSVPKEDTFSVEIRTLDEAINISDNIMSFCKEKKLSQRCSYLSGLAIEEMVGNILNYGFADEKKHGIDVYVIKDKNDLIIRIRDNCELFDPLQYLEQFKNADITKNIGIKLVADTAKDMKYQRILDLNFLTICLQG